MTVESGSDYIRVTISFHQKQMLRLLAERGGETDFRFGRVQFKGDETEEAKAALIEQCRLADESVRAMGKDPLCVITITPLIGTDRNLLRLTDAGRQVIEQMGLVVKPISLRVDLRTGKEIKG